MEVLIVEELNIFHLGKLFLKSIKEQPRGVSQIDGFLNRKETNTSLLERTVRLAASFRNYGLIPGDVVAFSGRNHLDIQIPHYAGLIEGLPVTCMNPVFDEGEVRLSLTQTKPRILFCQHENAARIQNVIDELRLNCKIVTFDGGYTMNDFINEYTFEPVVIEEYEPQDFDPCTNFAWIISTSGAAGPPKMVAFTHKVISETIYFLHAGFNPADHNMCLNLSPSQWASSFYNAIMNPVHHNTNLQSSGPHTVEHIIDLINRYQPTSAMFSPLIANQIIKYEERCDLNCFKSISLGGSKVYRDTMIKLTARTRGKVLELYGLTEALGPVLFPPPNTPIGSCGKEYNRFQVKLVDPRTGEIIKKPKRIGELLVQGALFAEYYKNPEETAKAFTEDGWFKTGDLFYRDERDFYYFVDRYMMVIRTKDTDVYPGEIEEVIRQHEDVIDAAVVGVAVEDSFNETAAIVVRKAEANITAQDIKEIVANFFPEQKRLYGGVAFCGGLPLTSTGKVAVHKLDDLLKTLKRR